MLEDACRWDNAIALKLRERTEDLKNVHIHRLQGNVDYFQVNYYKLHFSNLNCSSKMQTGILSLKKPPTKQEKRHRLDDTNYQ